MSEQNTINEIATHEDAASDISNEPIDNESVAEETGKPESIEEITAEKTLDDFPLPDEPENSEQKTWPKGFADRLKREKEKRQQLGLELEQLRLQALGQPSLNPLQPPQFNPTPQQQINPAQMAPNVSHGTFDLPVPKRDNYISEEAYIDARTDYMIAKRENEYRYQQHVTQQQQQAAQIQQANRSFMERWVNSKHTGVDKYPDFEEKFSALNSDDFPSNRAMAEAIVDSPYKDDILYFLGQHKDHAKKIAQLNPIQAVKNVAAIEARFANRQKASSSAPPPPSQLGGGTKGGTFGDPSKMGMDEFTEWYKAKYKKN